MVANWYINVLLDLYDASKHVHLIKSVGNVLENGTTNTFYRKIVAKTLKYDWFRAPWEMARTSFVFRYY